MHKPLLHEPLPYLGYGLGLRSIHIPYIFESKPDVGWFEVITEDFMVDGGIPHANLTKIRENYPLVMHGVSLSIGSSDALDYSYLTQLKKLIERYSPEWVSDHLCWTGISHINSHDLLPLPYSEEMLEYLISRIRIVQDFLNQRILLENPSSYITYNVSTMPEWEFLANLTKEADCLLLLDINNVYVSSYNHSFDPIQYIDYLPKDRVQQFHLAGHTNKGKFIVDSHDQTVIDNVWKLYAYAVKRFGLVSTMIERDSNIPPFPELYNELMYAKAIADQALIQIEFPVAEEEIAVPAN